MCAEVICVFNVHLGLGCITECVKAGAWSTEVLYVCGACVCRLSKADMRNHILGSLHRFNYIVSSTGEGLVTADHVLRWILLTDYGLFVFKRKPGTLTWYQNGRRAPTCPSWRGR